MASSYPAALCPCAQQFSPGNGFGFPGPSMVPTLRDGDVVIVRHGAPVRSGDVVLARFRDMPDRPVLKRVSRREGDGWWLVSDNPWPAATVPCTVSPT